MKETLSWSPGRPWQDHPPTFRAAEMQQLARWITTGASGSVIGLRGSGRSNLLGFLCYRPEVLRIYLADPTLNVLPVLVDLNNLPDSTLATFYRVLLRAFYELRAQLPGDLRELIAQLFLANLAATDPFLPQSALRELLFQLQARGSRVVLVMDRFDSFCRMITPEMGDTLVGLRDSFRDILSYIVGVRQSLVYLDTLQLASDFMRLLTTHTCYLGPYNEADARQMIGRLTQVADVSPSEPEVAAMLGLTGGYPTLLKAVCRWWLLTPVRPPLERWLPTLANELAIQQRLRDIWIGLTQEEQQVLAELQASSASQNGAPPRNQQRREAVLETLSTKGVLRRQDTGWSLFGELFWEYVQQVGGSSRGAIWLDTQTQTLHHGHVLLDNLTPKERSVLEFLVRHPNEHHTYTDVIVSAWSDEERYHGVSNDSLFQVIRGLRQKIEPNPADPVYVVNWRGKPEGGYLLFPEGRPNESNH